MLSVFKFFCLYSATAPVLLFSITNQALNFGPALDINIIKTQYATNPALAINSQGNAIAVWQEAGDYNNIYARNFTSGSGWQAIATDLNYVQTQSADYPKIAMDSSNGAIAVWQEYNGSINHIYASRFDGTTWQTTVTLNNDLSTDAQNPQITMNPAGQAIAVWIELNATYGVYNVYARSFDGIWGSAENLNVMATQYQYPQVAMDTMGNAIAVWCEDNGEGYGYYNIHARNYISGSGWDTSASNLNNNPHVSSMEPQIAMISTSTAIAVWAESVDIPGGSAWNVFARNLNGTTWETAIDLNNTQTRSGESPQIAINSSGNAMVVWSESNDSYTTNIYTKKYNPESGWDSTAVNLNNDQSQPAGGAKVGLDTAGNAIVAWGESVAAPAYYNVFAKKYSVDNSWESTVNLNNDQFQLAQTILLAMNATGNAMVVWPEGTFLRNIFTRQIALPYYFSQWSSVPSGSRQYISAGRYDNTTDSSSIDMYEYDDTLNHISFVTSLTVAGTLDHFAVYNKSDTELYSAIITSTPDSLSVWLFNGSIATRITDLSASVTLPIYDAQWWAPSVMQSYLATIGDSALTVLDLVESNSNNNSISASGNKLLWTQATNYTGLVVLNGTVATPYEVDLTTSPISITEGNGITAPTGFTFTALSTCGDYIAVGLSSTNTTEYGYARVALLNLDSTTNTLSMSSTATTLLGQTTVNALARCCCCATLRPLLVGSYDTSRNYTISIFQPDLSSIITSAFLGNNAGSVAWSCQGINRYLTASSSEINECRYTVEYILGANGLSLPIVVTH